MTIIVIIRGFSRLTMLNHEVSIAEAKARFSELVNRVVYGGEQIVITRRGRPVAVLTAPSKKGLHNVKGWLQESDPFFGEIQKIENKRHSRGLRAARSGKV